MILFLVSRKLALISWVQRPERSAFLILSPLTPSSQRFSLRQTVRTYPRPLVANFAFPNSSFTVSGVLSVLREAAKPYLPVGKLGRELDGLGVATGAAGFSFFAAVHRPKKSAPISAITPPARMSGLIHCGPRASGSHAGSAYSAGRCRRPGAVRLCSSRRLGDSSPGPGPPGPGPGSGWCGAAPCGVPPGSGPCAPPSGACPVSNAYGPPCGV